MQKSGYTVKFEGKPQNPPVPGSGVQSPRIRQLEAETRKAASDTVQMVETVTALTVELARVTAAGDALAGATASLRRAVLGPDGYQAAIQIATGFEYPWPALGFAAEATETALAAWATTKEANHE